MQQILDSVVDLFFQVVYLKSKCASDITIAYSTLTISVKPSITSHYQKGRKIR